MIRSAEKNIELYPKKSEDGVEIYELPCTGEYRWCEELKGVLSTWSPLCWRDHSMRQWFFPNYCEAVYQCGAPVMAAIDADDKNSLTVSLSDSVIRSKITMSVDDLNQRDEIIVTVTLFDETVRQQKDGKVLLRVDRRRIDWNDTVCEAGVWMRSFLPSLIKIPENAALPLYSSWYDFHQEPEQYLLERELEKAAEIGFKTFILDDGWQFEGNNTGDYSKCGDWSVAKDKFPDFKAFCDRVHSFGIKMLMWFPVPFVGFETEDYKRLKHIMAYDNPAFGAGVLDVRYPEAREYIINTYKRFVRDYGVDGLKLDFIDAFNVRASEIPPANDKTDVGSIDEAVRILMNEIYAEMTAYDPDFMFEFRQNYVGAEMVNHCNMLRVCDCAADPVTNRIGMAALKLVNSATAIHSDMLLWGHNEDPLNCRRQLLNILFSVPQISVRLTEVPEEHLRVIRGFVKYWLENKDVLYNGRFRARHPELNYTEMSAEKDGKKITVIHHGGVFTPDCDADIFNNTDCDRLVSTGGRRFEYGIYDIYGEKTKTGVSDGTPAILPVARGGMIRIKILY